MEEEELRKIEKSSRRSGLLSLVGILTFIGSLIYASISLNNANNKLSQVEKELKKKELQLDSLNNYFRKLSQNVDGLKNDEKKLADFLIQLLRTTEENSTRGNDIDWNKVAQSIIDLPSGKRKTAVLIALLMTWKEIPFDLGTSNPSMGFDSPSFLIYVLNQVGINVDKKPKEFLSVAIMNKFQKIDKPLPGDLIFYKGQTGNFGLMYLCGGDEEGQGVAIGTLQSISPLAIYETKYINRPFFPFIGFYRVNYEDHEGKSDVNKRN